MKEFWLNLTLEGEDGSFDCFPADPLKDGEVDPKHLLRLIDFKSYQSLQEKYEEMNFQNENLELSEKFFQEKTNELQSRVKELSEENERLKLALRNHHEQWSENGICLIECSLLCKALSGKDGVDE